MKFIRVGVLQFFIAARFVNLAVSLPQYQFASHTPVCDDPGSQGSSTLVCFASVFHKLNRTLIKEMDVRLRQVLRGSVPHDLLKANGRCCHNQLLAERAS
jgi:hypothetical protein